MAFYQHSANGDFCSPPGPRCRPFDTHGRYHHRHASASSDPGSDEEMPQTRKASPRARLSKIRVRREHPVLLPGHPGPCRRAVLCNQATRSLSRCHAAIRSSMIAAKIHLLSLDSILEAGESTNECKVIQNLSLGQAPAEHIRCSMPQTGRDKCAINRKGDDGRTSTPRKQDALQPVCRGCESNADSAQNATRSRLSTVPEPIGPFPGHAANQRSAQLPWSRPCGSLHEENRADVRSIHYKRQRLVQNIPPVSQVSTSWPPATTP